MNSGMPRHDETWRQIVKTRTNSSVLLGGVILGLWLIPSGRLGAAEGGPDLVAASPRILCHPQSQTVDIDYTNRVVFEVLAEPGVPLRYDSLQYQWERSPVIGMGRENWEALGGQTNSTLELVLPEGKAATNDVAHYRVRVREGEEEAVSFPASLVVYWRGESAYAFGPPTFTSGATGASCPGRYAGYVVYLKNSGWGWKASGEGTLEFQDRGQTKGFNALEAVQFGSPQLHCAPFQETRLSIPHPPAGSLWRFAVYFPVEGPLPPARPYQVYIKNAD